MSGCCFVGLKCRPHCTQHPRAGRQITALTMFPFQRNQFRASSLAEGVQREPLGMFRLGGWLRGLSGTRRAGLHFILSGPALFPSAFEEEKRGLAQGIQEGPLRSTFARVSGHVLNQSSRSHNVNKRTYQRGEGKTAFFFFFFYRKRRLK